MINLIIIAMWNNIARTNTIEYSKKDWIIAILLLIVTLGLSMLVILTTTNPILK